MIAEHRSFALLSLKDIVIKGSVLCFAEGTRIAKPQGETAVEALQIGDVVTPAEGR